MNAAEFADVAARALIYSFGVAGAIALWRGARDALRERRCECGGKGYVLSPTGRRFDCRVCNIPEIARATALRPIERGQPVFWKRDVGPWRRRRWWQR